MKITKLSELEGKDKVVVSATVKVVDVMDIQHNMEGKQWQTLLITDGDSEIWLNLWKRYLGQFKVGDTLELKACYYRLNPHYDNQPEIILSGRGMIKVVGRAEVQAQDVGAQVSL